MRGFIILKAVIDEINITELLASDYKSDYCSRMIGDLSSMFYENEATVINMNNGMHFTTSNLSFVETRIFGALSEINEYVKCINDGRYLHYDIIPDVIDQFIATYVHESSDGFYYLDFKISKEELYEEEIEGLGIRDCTDTVNLRYDMDWLFEYERSISTSEGDFHSMCGPFDDFCNFLNNSVTVVEAKRDRNHRNIYNVIYHN